MAKLSVERAIGKARSHESSGELDQALQQYQAVLKQYPGNVRARQGVARLAQRDTQSNPAGPPREELEEAIRLFRLGQRKQAFEQIDRMLKAFPNSATLWNLEGTLRGTIGDYERAETAFHRVIAMKPVSAEAHNNLGIVLTRKGEIEAALTALNNALLLKPDYAEAHNNLGNALLAQGNADAAARSYRKAIDCQNGMAQAHINLGHALQELGQLDEAIASFSRGLSLEPGNEEVQSHLIHLRQWICDWSLYDGDFDGTVASLGLNGKAIPPFNALAMEDSAAHQLARSVRWTNQKHSAGIGRSALHPMRTSSKLRIGYFSADFHDHATIFLLAGLLREHDRSKFEIHIYHFGKADMGRWREPLSACADAVHEVHGLSDAELAGRARADNLDIAIDLKGYTKENRSRIFASRIAPMQISFLGYPGSMGADFIDYIVADKTVIPDGQRQHYSEKVIYLPGSYQPNDDTRPIAQTDTRREDFGLPEDGFVFCCFNQTYKITPREFDIWMRMLGQVEGSVLWLLRSNIWAETNLGREAENRGIAGDRLVFADKLPHDLHLARHKHADLFIDTFNVNAHTTASDALWAGLPIVTKAGEQFAARVAASLLHAIGLDELVTETDEEYERRILELANNPELLQAAGATLAENRQTHGLFDTRRYAESKILIRSLPSAFVTVSVLLVGSHA